MGEFFKSVYKYIYKCYNACESNKRTSKYQLQYGGPDGELAASLRYLSQRFSMPTEITKATLNDIGTEELRTP